jgi:hypothetical protein
MLPVNDLIGYAEASAEIVMETVSMNELWSH